MAGPTGLAPRPEKGVTILGTSGNGGRDAGGGVLPHTRAVAEISGTRLARRRDGIVADAHDHPDVRGHLPRRSRPEPPDALRWASGWLHRGHASGDCSPSDATALRAALFTCCDYCASFASFFDTAHARPGMRRGAPELAAASALGGRNAGSGTGWTKDMVMSRSVPPKPLTGGARPLGRRPYYRQRLPSGTSPS